MERWMDIPGSAGHYQVSDLGRVRSVDRVVAHSTAGTLRLRGRVLSLVSRPDGHLGVTVKADGLLRPRLVHRLVLLAFVGPPEMGQEGCHWDGDPSNNVLTNLRWGTRGQNVRDAVRHGTHHQTAKATCPLGHALVAPNLRAGAHRKCRSCHLAQSWARHLRTRKGLVVTSEQLAAEADRRYVLDGTVESVLR